MYDELHQECVLLVCAVAYTHVAVCLESRAAKRIGGAQGKYKEWPHNMDCGRARPQEILHALKCVLGASEASLCACLQYIYTCKLLSLFTSFRS